jgi:hypothetical protein
LAFSLNLSSITLSNQRNNTERKIKMKVIKSIKTITLSLILGLILLVASVNSTNAGQREAVTLKSPSVEVIKASPGPRHVWVRGHYRIRLRGRMVWVPAHWRKK